MYLLGSDVGLVVGRFDEDPAIAWLVGEGQGRWRAVARLDRAPPGRTGLWHVPSGPLPLVGGTGLDSPDGQIPDPWAGWADPREEGNPGTPYFGPGHPGVYWLNVRGMRQGAIGMSTIEWIGNHYRIIGSPADPQTERHWKALRRWAGRVGTKIPRTGPLNGPGQEIFAFPAALAAVRSGQNRAANPG
jgi:hypothetical protein